MNKCFKSYFFLYVLLFSIKLFSGFAADTMVKVPGGYKSIEQLQPGNIVYSITKSGDCCLSRVKKTTSYFLSKVIAISLGDDVIIAAPQQKFYDPEKNVWCKAKYSQKSKQLLSGYKNIIFIDDIQILDQEVEFFDISLEDEHTFFVGTRDVVVHNFPPFFIGCSIAFGGGISFEGLYLGICIAGWWLGTQLLKQGNNKKYNPSFSVGCTPAYAGGPDPEDEDWFEKLKKSAKEKALHYQFKKFYKDPKTGLWWSKANGSAHAGSHYKVFQERATYLEWIKDVDLLGNVMKKHKGPIGQIIPYKELVFY